MQRQIIIFTGDTQFRDALKRVCSGQGYRIETVDSAESALEIASLVTKCVVIADASGQDEGDGVGLASAIHEQNPAAKCFLVVDEDSPDVLSSVENEPWLRVVYKPIRMLQLSADVIDAIAK